MASKTLERSLSLSPKSFWVAARVSVSPCKASIVSTRLAVRSLTLRSNVSWDFWIPHQSVAFEFHGRQHDEYVKFFHGTKAGFRKQKASDAKKKAIADLNDVTLIIIRENDMPDWSLENLKEIIIMEMD